MKKSIISLLLACAMLLTLFPAALAYDGAAPVSEEPLTISVLSTNGASLYYDFDNMTWWPVSYTHLDVYKRQELSFPHRRSCPARVRRHAATRTEDRPFVTTTIIP